MSETARPMTPAEKYYAFLDQTWPMNATLVADLAVVLPAEVVAAQWRRFTAERVLTRMIATADLTVADGGTSRTDFASREMASSEWDRELARESGIAYGLERGMRCRYLASPDEGRSRLFLIAHHSIADGRSGIAELQAFVRMLDGQAVQVQRRLSQPVAADPGRYAWQTDRRALIELLRGIQERNASAGEPVPPDWPSAGLERRPRIVSQGLTAAESRRLLDRGRERGVRAFPALAAGWLIAVAEEIGAGTPATLQLNTPVDLSGVNPFPDRPPPTAVAVLSHRFRVDSTAPWSLATQVMTATAASVQDGEAELFFHLARSDRTTDLAAGARAVADSIAAAPPAVTVSSLGVIDPGTDPEWLTSVCGYQASTPNQIAFVAGTGYRGRQLISVATDDNRLAPHAAESVVARYRDVFARMTAQPHAGSDEATGSSSWQP